MFTYSNGFGKCPYISGGVFFFGGGDMGFQGRWLRGKIFPWGNLSWEKRISINGVQDFLALCKKKNNEKINMKKFFQLKVRTSIKT